MSRVYSVHQYTGQYEDQWGPTSEVADRCSNGICDACPMDSVAYFPGDSITTIRSSFSPVSTPDYDYGAFCEESVSVECPRGYKLWVYQPGWILGTFHSGTLPSFRRDSSDSNWMLNSPETISCQRCGADEYQPFDGFTGPECTTCPQPTVSNAARTGCEDPCDGVECGQHGSCSGGSCVCERWLAYMNPEGRCEVRFASSLSVSLAVVSLGFPSHCRHHQCC